MHHPIKVIQRPRRNIQWHGPLPAACEHEYEKIPEVAGAAPRRCVKCGRLEVNL